MHEKGVRVQPQIIPAAKMAKGAFQAKTMVSDGQRQGAAG